MASEHVLIIGAGLGGLALAHGLQKAGISFHVYERDPAADYRPQGYRVRISPDGAEALHKMLPQHLWEAFEKACANTGGGLSSVDAISGLVQPSQKPIIPRSTRTGFSSYTADRIETRRVLLRDLSGISFGKEAVRFEEDSDAVRVFFSDGTSATGTLLVGADGVRSAVRRQYLRHLRPIDAQGRAIYGKSILTPELEAQLSDAIRSTTCLIQEPVTGDRVLSFFSEIIRFPANGIPHPADYVYWVLLAHRTVFAPAAAIVPGVPEDADFVPGLKSDAAAEVSLVLTKHWSAGIRAVLEAQDRSQSSALRICSAVPDRLRAIGGQNHATSERITLLGDAVHVAPPAGGQGANLALRDAAELAASLSERSVQHRSLNGVNGSDRQKENGVANGGYAVVEQTLSLSLERVVYQYENSMRDYAIPAIEASLRGGQKMFNQPAWDQCEDAVF